MNNKSNMKFAVDGTAVVCNILDGEIKARRITVNDEGRREKYVSKGVIDTSPDITAFIEKYPKVNRRVVGRNGSNFYGIIVSYSSLAGTKQYDDSLRNILKAEYGFSDAELDSMSGYFDDLHNLQFAPDVRRIISETEDYKRSIEDSWRLREPDIMDHINGILGYEPESKGNVQTYIMYPNFNTQRSLQLGDASRIFMYYGKYKSSMQDDDESYKNKVLSSLAHQAVHQPKLPYKRHYTSRQKEVYHAFIKYLTDKEIYNYLSYDNRSYLDITTVNENPEIMAKMYPFWLGYRFRNADKAGLNPEEEIKRAISREKDYKDSLKKGSKARQVAEMYNLEKLDPKKIAKLFKGKRAMTPYEFAEMDFDDIEKVYKDLYLEGIRR